MNARMLIVLALLAAPAAAWAAPVENPGAIESVTVYRGQALVTRTIQIDTAAGLRTYPEARREDVPGIVAGLVAAGEPVYGVRVVQTTLEEAYLEAVEDSGP